ncbi:hypothetical protein [Asticcacaulis endophyticus]|uniref:Beta/Gamma crystallin n=1 Tax=Asticcacaulis endophyticus TaxID=1395890 RepID=A0A918PTY7_9CAUL|nr:hypothetical protein [Asticcacaulis endophyticus]GGZ21918.1 hypothetical protein GCM10011273_03390 [Asticcacaulis endophyticus]
MKPTILTLALTALAFPAIADEKQNLFHVRINKLEVGLPADRVIDIMGPAADRQFQGNREALQYCSRDGWAYNDFVVVWLSDGNVSGLTRYNKPYTGKCERHFRDLDWRQAPGATEEPK